MRKPNKATHRTPIRLRLRVLEAADVGDIEIGIAIGIERRRAWPKEQVMPHLETIPIAIAIWPQTTYTVKRTGGPAFARGPSTNRTKRERLFPT